MATTIAALRKRKYLESNSESLNNALDKERKYITRFVYGMNDDCITTKLFTPAGLLEPETTNLGMLMFRFDTELDSPKYLVISVLFLAMRAYNTQASTKATLLSLYRDTMAQNVLTMLDTYKAVEHKLCVLGVTNMVSVGTNCLVSCAMQGNAYDIMKENVYGLTVLKDLLIEPDWEPRVGGTQHIYVTFIYKSVDGRLQYGLFVVLTGLSYEKLTIELVRRTFARERFLFMNHLVSNDSEITHFGSIQKIGSCLTEDVKSGTLDYKGTSLPVVKLENVYVDIGTKHRFI